LSPASESLWIIFNSIKILKSLIFKNLTISCLLEHMLLNNDNRASCCWLHRSLFCLILPFYLFTIFFMISPIHLVNRVAYMHDETACTHTHSQSYIAISQSVWSIDHCKKRFEHIYHHFYGCLLSNGSFTT